MQSVLSYSITFFWVKCLKCCCWMPELYSFESCWVCPIISKFWWVSWSRWECVLAHPQPVLPSERVQQVACQQRKQMFDHTGMERLLHQELGIPLDIWTWLVRDACLRPGGCRSHGAESMESLLLFKRLVHWSSNNVELSLGCFLLRNLGIIGESGRSIYSKVMFRETRLIIEY